MFNIVQYQRIERKIWPWTKWNRPKYSL